MYLSAKTRLCNEFSFFPSYVRSKVKSTSEKDTVTAAVNKDIGLSKGVFNYLALFDLLLTVISILDLSFGNNPVGIPKEGVHFVFLLGKLKPFARHSLEELSLLRDVLLQCFKAFD